MKIDAGQFPGKNGGARIQAAIDSLGERPKVIEVGPQGPDVDGQWELSEAILIPSNTTILLYGSRLFMADSVSDNLMRNLHADSGDDQRDENIHIVGLGGTALNGNAENQVRQAQVYRNFGISFHKVERASIQGLTLGPTAGWGMGLENVNDLAVDTIRFQQDGKTKNQDGIHICGPGSRINISNIMGTVADDAIALDAGAGAEDDRGSARGFGGRLENIVVSNVSVRNLGSGAVVRTVAAKGKPLDGVFISQVMITDANQVLKIGWDRWGAKQSGRDIGDVFPGCDEQKNIVIDGVKGTTEDVFCRIESNVRNLTIKNVRGRCGASAFTNITPDGDCFSMENVLLEDWMIEGCQSGIEIGGGVQCSNFTVKNSVFAAAHKSGRIGLHLSGKAETLDLNRLTVDNVVFDGFSMGMKIDANVQIANAISVVNSDFSRSRNELNVPENKIKFMGLHSM